MVAIRGNTIVIPNPSQEIITYCKQELTLPNPEYAKKARMGFWLGKTPKNISLYSMKDGAAVLPYGCWDDVKAIAPDILELRQFAPACAVNYGEPIPLYDYQERAVQAMYDKGSGILLSHTGSGKTRMALALIKKLGLRTLWLTHTGELLRQSKSAAEEFYDKELLGTITEGKINIGSGITFATVQTMSKIDVHAHAYTWNVIVVDECHRCAGSPTKLTMFSKVLNALAAQYKIGLTATAHRADGLIRATYALLGNITHEVSDEDIADKVMDARVIPIFTGVELHKSCLATDGTRNHGKTINYITQHSGRNQLIVDTMIENKDVASLVLSDRVEHLIQLMENLPDDMRDKAVIIHGGMTTKAGKAAREQAIVDMRSGEKLYLFATYALAKEGLDIPRLENLYLTTPQKDKAVITQSVGRIVRVAEGKGVPTVYDFVDDMQFAVRMYKARCSIYRNIHCEIEV